MKLPNVDQCIVEDNKMSNYLLDLTHPEGGSKAKFFLNAGFSREDVEQFRSALLRHAADREIVGSRDTGYGIMHELRCEISTPNKRNPCVITVWIIDNESGNPRLVTAIPQSR